MWLNSELCSATFLLALIALIVVVPGESFVTSYHESNIQAQNGDPYRTWRSSEARFLNVGGIGRLGGYFSRFYQYFETGMNFLFGDDDRSGGNNKKVKYNRYQLLRVTPRTSGQVNDIVALKDEVDGLSYWTQPAKNQSADILVPPDLVSDVKQFFNMRGLDFFVLIKDIQKAIAQQNPRMTRDQRIELRDSKGHEMTFKRYHRYPDMLKYLEYLSNKYPDLVEIITIGKSSLGLPLKVLKISTGQRTKKGDMKPAVWIDGGGGLDTLLTTDSWKPANVHLSSAVMIKSCCLYSSTLRCSRAELGAVRQWIDQGMHPREWISPAVAMYTVKQLVENFKVNKRVVEGADWYILPVANPDGYEYTHTTDRLWRKTRSNHESDDTSRYRTISSYFFGQPCRGVDMNRNWEFHWGEIGASDDPCHETYAGPRAFSEPETRAISDFIMDRKDRIKLYLTMHAYSQMWLVPWGYTNKKTGDYEDLMSMGKKAVDALNRISGTLYKLGSATSLLYPSSGSSDDWAKGAAGIKYAYTVELRDDGTYGFFLPASQIVATGRETFAAIKAIAKAIVCKN